MLKRLCMMFPILGALFLLTLTSKSMDMPKSQLKLFSLGKVENIYYAAIEIKMDKGIKTYWKHPGSSGIPAEFNWGGSENIQSIEVLWPTPSLIGKDEEQSIGYLDQVVIPLKITPKDLKKAPHIQLSLEYAICGKICIPTHGDASLTLPSEKANATQIASYLSTSPARIQNTSKLFPSVTVKDENAVKYLELGFKEEAKPAHELVFIDHIDHPMGVIHAAKDGLTYRIKLSPQLVKKSVQTHIVVPQKDRAYEFSLDLSAYNN